MQPAPFNCIAGASALLWRERRWRNHSTESALQLHTPDQWGPRGQTSLFIKWWHTLAICILANSPFCLGDSWKLGHKMGGAYANPSPKWAFPGGSGVDLDWDRTKTSQICQLEGFQVWLHTISLRDGNAPLMLISTIQFLGSTSVLINVICFTGFINYIILVAYITAYGLYS